MRFNKINALIIIILIISILLRLFLFNINPYVSPDEAVYFTMAKSLDSKGYGWVGSLDQSQAGRPPTLIYFLLPFAKFGYEKLAMPILSILSILAVYFICRKWFSKEHALLASLAVATNPLHFFFSFRALPEIIFGLLILICVFLLPECFKNKRLFIPLGFFTALAILTRYTGLILLIIYILYLLFIQTKKIIPTFKSIYFYIGIMIFAVIIFLWRQVYQGGEFGNRIGGLFSFFFIPFGLTPRSIFILGALLPLILILIYKYKLLIDGNIRIGLIFASLIFFIVLQDLVMEDMRYLTPLVPLASILVAYRAEIWNKWLKIIFIFLCVINLFGGIFFLYGYSNQNETVFKFNAITNPFSVSGEYKEYYDAAMILKNISTANEIIISTNGAHYVSYYANRESSSNLNNLLDKKHAYIITYDGDRHYPLPEELKDWKIVFDGQFVKVLENVRDMR